MSGKADACLLPVVLACVVVCPAIYPAQEPAGQSAAVQAVTERRVMAFYYPWYGIPEGPGGAGQTVHWGKIDAEHFDIEASTHYPFPGAYDSHDPAVIDRHCRWAKAAGIDTFIASWWGHDDYTDRAMPILLDKCREHGLRACIYYETVPRPKTPQAAAQDVIRVLDKYGSHEAHLKVNGKPVVFIYVRAVEELGLTGWLEAVKLIKGGYTRGATILGDQFSYGAARVFDGVHTYNTAGSLAGLSADEVKRWASGTYPSWVRLADEAGKISTITVIPGYDDTKIRTPGLKIERFDGDLYRVQWDQAIAADPHWVLVTSFNEWHEGSEVEPSLEYGLRYTDLSAKPADRFKASPRPDHPVAGTITPEQKDRLRQKLQRIRIAVLPGAESMAFWWLLDLGVGPQLLTWEQVAGGDLTPARYPVLLYCSGEQYRRTVYKTNDVDGAIERYLRAGGGLAALPSLPWPFFYDENGKTVNQSHRFGLTLQGGWEQPPQGTGLEFVQRGKHLPHVPERFAFPITGDLRWRPFYVQDHVEHVPLLQLRNGAGEYLGDAAVYARPSTGGQVAYVWFGLLRGWHAEPLLYDLFTLLADHLKP